VAVWVAGLADRRPAAHRGRTLLHLAYIVCDLHTRVAVRVSVGEKFDRVGSSVVSSILPSSTQRLRSTRHLFISSQTAPAPARCTILHRHRALRARPSVLRTTEPATRPLSFLMGRKRYANLVLGDRVCGFFLVRDSMYCISSPATKRGLDSRKHGMGTAGEGEGK
jgi:hypothetical protein